MSKEFESWRYHWDDDDIVVAPRPVEDAWNPDQPREPAGSPEGGQFASAGGGITQSEQGVRPSSAEIKSEAAKVARDMGFDDSRIDVVAGTRTFELNGQVMTAAGDADIVHGEEGRIRLYHDHLTKASAAGVIAHEIQHAKFQGALDAYRRESDALMKDPGPPPNPEGHYFWEKRGGSDAIMKPDGGLREPYDKKYPVYTAMQTAFYMPALDEFAKGDGVSKYSAEWWAGVKAGKVSFTLAVHETLAEMSRIKYETGKYPEHFGFSRVMHERGATAENYFPPAKGKAEGTKLWRNLHRTVNEIYENKVYGEGVYKEQK